MRSVSPQSRIAHTIADMPLVQAVFHLADRLSVPVYLVGGTVRDILLGRETHDLDFAVDGDGLRVARAAADSLGGAFVSLDAARRTGRVVLTSSPDRAQPLGALHIDFASFRGEGLEADLRDRDFTVNAMAVARSDDGTLTLVDPLQGSGDLRNRVLRAASPGAFVSDPVRTLRAVRQSAQFTCALDPQTRTWLTDAVPLLADVSAERVRDEWFKILDLPEAAEATAELARLGLLHTIAPPLSDLEPATPGGMDLLAHALETVRAVDRLWAAFQEHAGWREIALPAALAPLLPHLRARYASTICDERTHLALLRCAALLHDVGKAHDRGEESAAVAGAAVARRLARRWRCSNAEREMLERAVGAHVRPSIMARQASLDRRTIYRYYRDCGPYGLDAAFVALADHAATWGTDASAEGWRQQVETVTRLWSAYLLHREQVDPPPLISGRDLMSLGLSPGPEIGALLAEIREAQAVGEIGSRAQALEYAQDWVEASAERTE